MFGEISSTVKGFFWPYYLMESRRKAVPLNHAELTRFVAIVPELANPELTELRVATARGILKEHAEETGAPVTKAQFDDQIGWLALQIEWNAELSASATASWDRQSVAKSARYEELSQALEKYDKGNDIADGDGLLLACSKRQISYTASGVTIPTSRSAFQIVEQRYRIALTLFNKLVAAVSDLLQP
jgi:hypothetical protein